MSKRFEAAEASQPMTAQAQHQGFCRRPTMTEARKRIEREMFIKPVCLSREERESKEAMDKAKRKELFKKMRDEERTY
jgi:hypothetical protein